MSFIQCNKCDEVVDASKAFCPGCGNALVKEETRVAPTTFDRSEKTVQFGPTMYNQLLSDMGLDISEAPNKEEKVVGVIVPLTAEAAFANEKEMRSPVQEFVDLTGTNGDRPKNTNKNLPIILSIIAVGFFILSLILAGAILVFLFWSRLR